MGALQQRWSGSSSRRFSSAEGPAQEAERAPPAPALAAPARRRSRHGAPGGAALPTDLPAAGGGSSMAAAARTGAAASLMHAPGPAWRRAPVRGCSEEQEQQRDEGSASLPGCRSAAALSRPRGRHLGNSLRGQRRRQHRYGAPGGTGRARGARSAAAGRAPGADFPLSPAGAGSGRALGSLRFPPAPRKSHLRSSPRGPAFIPRRGRDGGAAELSGTARGRSLRGPRSCRCSFPHRTQGQKENRTAERKMMVSLSSCQLPAAVLAPRTAPAEAAATTAGSEEVEGVKDP